MTMLTRNEAMHFAKVEYFNRYVSKLGTSCSGNGFLKHNGLTVSYIFSNDKPLVDVICNSASESVTFTFKTSKVWEKYHMIPDSIACYQRKLNLIDCIAHCKEMISDYQKDLARYEKELRDLI